MRVAQPFCCCRANCSQSRYGDKSLYFQVVCPRNGTVLLDGLAPRAESARAQHFFLNKTFVFFSGSPFVVGLPPLHSIYVYICESISRPFMTPSYRKQRLSSSNDRTIYLSAVLEIVGQFIGNLFLCQAPGRSDAFFITKVTS